MAAAAPVAETTGPSGPPIAGPTLVASGQSRRSGLPRGRALLALAVVALVVVVGGGATLVVRKLTTPTPESVVGSFFDALRKGDAAAAQGMLQDPAFSGLGDAPLLSAQALSDQGNRPQDVRVHDARSGPSVPFSWTGTVDALYSVDVDYRAAGREISQVVVVAHLPGADPALRLATGLVEVTAPATWGPLTVNGIELGTDGTRTHAFPGGYRVSVPGNQLFSAVEQVVVPAAAAPGTYGVTATLDPGTPQLAPGAQEAINAKVHSLIDTCATSTDPAPSECPFSLLTYNFGDTVQWSVTQYPQLTVSVTPAGFGSGSYAVDVETATPGSMSATVTTTDVNGTPATSQQSVDVSVHGTATVDDSGIQLSLT